MKVPTTTTVRCMWVAVLLYAAMGLTGCGTVTVATPLPPPIPPPPPTPPSYSGVSFGVSVFAGSRPISGASVLLYAAGTTGNGSAASSLVSASITTAADGTATVPSTYNCPATTSMLYLVSEGGTVSGASEANAETRLMTLVGPCSDVTTATKATINEATTVAAIEALAPFYLPGKGIGASATNVSGLANAYATAGTLADPVTGITPGSTLPVNAVSPADRVNSLANLVNACVVSQAVCGTFFNAVGGSPTNTLDALYELAKSPTSNVDTLYKLAVTSSAYTPALADEPTDWTMFVTYSGAGLSTPTGIGVDSTGNVWVANYFYNASKFSPTGEAVFPNGITGSGLNNSYGLSIDTSDNVWIPNEQPYYGTQSIGSVTVLTSSGAAVTGCCGYVGYGFDFPISIANDPNGTTWVVDYGDSRVSLLRAAVSIAGDFGYTAPSFAFPVVVVVDGNHFGWVGDQSDSFVTKVAPDGSSFTPYDCCQGATGIAIDQSNNVWLANYYGNSVSMISSSGTIVSKGAYTGNGSLDHPQGIAVDGAGNIWVANYRETYLTELAGASSATPGASLTPAAGLGGDAQLLEAYAMALDASGNIWVSNLGSNTVTKFIGLAVPVKTPLAGVPQAP